MLTSVLVGPDAFQNRHFPVIRVWLWHPASRVAAAGEDQGIPAGRVAATGEDQGIPAGRVAAAGED